MEPYCCFQNCSGLDDSRSLLFQVSVDFKGFFFVLYLHLAGGWGGETEVLKRAVHWQSPKQGSNL